MKHFLLAALLIALPASLFAQRSGFAHFSGHSTNFSAPHFSHRGYSGAGYYPLGLFDPLYSDYLSSTGYPVASQPPNILMQSPQPATAREVSTSSSQPLMIELQGDRYVQISGDRNSDAQMIDQFPVAHVTRNQVAKDSDTQTLHPAPQPTVAVLVFRDGRRQEISAYTIADGVLYATADYYTSGAWNQKIDLSSLNLADTIASNNSRGLRFQLPSSPNEVIVGP